MVFPNVYKYRRAPDSPNFIQQFESCEEQGKLYFEENVRYTAENRNVDGSFESCVAIFRILHQLLDKDHQWWQWQNHKCPQVTIHFGFTGPMHSAMKLYTIISHTFALDQLLLWLCPRESRCQLKLNYLKEGYKGQAIYTAKLVDILNWSIFSMRLTQNK